MEVRDGFIVGIFNYCDSWWVLRIHVAVPSVCRFGGDRRLPRLVGIERSHAAWLDLADRGRATCAEATSFIGDLVWLADEIDRVFPGARGFVRPGFDEPDEVARLEAGEWT